MIQPLDNEQELLQRVAHGDESAFRLLFFHYWDFIYSTALLFTKSPDLSEDLSQDIFANLWIKRARLAEVDRLEGYLFISARNLIFDYLRKKVFHGAYDSYFLEYFSDTAPTPDRRLEAREFQATVDEAIASLTPQQQTAFRLSRYQGLSHEEIAQKMGISRQAVKSHIVRAIVRLRQQLGQNSPLSLLFVALLLLK